MVSGVRTLVTGGVRSGKSRHAESLLLPPNLPVDAPVSYLACGPQRDDADWALRVARHRERRPSSWSTVESTDAARAPLRALVDEHEWERAKGWALLKAMQALPYYRNTNPVFAAFARRTLARVLAA